MTDIMIAVFVALVTTGNEIKTESYTIDTGYKNMQSCTALAMSRELLRERQKYDNNPGIKGYSIRGTCLDTRIMFGHST